MTLSILAACRSSSTLEAADASNSYDAGTIERSWTPVPPSAEFPEPQGQQLRLDSVEQSAPNCTRANVTVAMWSEAVCFAHDDGKLMCAGRVAGVDFGTSFVDAGLTDVVQLIGTGGGGSAPGEPPQSAACALLADGRAFCRGELLNFGQFNTADGKPPTSTWTQWGTREDIRQLTTFGYSDTSSVSLYVICAIFDDRTAECHGRNAPVIEESNVRQLSYQSNLEEWVVNDPKVLRVGNGNSDCIVTPEGLRCHDSEPLSRYYADEGADSNEYGTLITAPSEAGRIVDGDTASDRATCWLTANGQVVCASWADVGLPPNIHQPYRERAVALATHLESPHDIYDDPPNNSTPPDSCAVMGDGSLWCVGFNHTGKFGTGSTASMYEATQVAPPGSVRIQCGQ